MEYTTPLYTVRIIPRTTQILDTEIPIPQELRATVHYTLSVRHY